MSLRFIYGRAGCGKTRFCLEEIRSRIESGCTGQLYLLVPEQYTFQAEKDLIDLIKPGGILKNEVLSFRRLAYKVFNEVGGITYPHIHPAGKSMILYRILDKMDKNLRYFKNSVDKPGFVGRLSELVKEFKHYNVTFDKLDEICGKLDDRDPLKDKITELKNIYIAFDKTVKERYRDADDDLTVAAEKMKMSKQFTDSEIWIDGFTDFTPQEYKIIEVLLTQARRVSITLVCDRLDDQTSELDVFSPAKKVYRKVLNLAMKNNVAYEPPVFLNPKPLYRFKDNPELAHLESNLNVHPYKVYPRETENISLFSSVNVFSEIEATAKDILRLCREKGFRFRDIAVVTRNLDEYQGLIEAVFNDYGIPCFLDRKLDISNHPLVILILSMLDIFTENWSYEAVFRYLKSGLTGIEQDRIDRLENYVLACGIRGNQWTEEKDWNMIPEFFPDENGSGHDEFSLEEINRTRKEIIKPLMEFRYKTKGRRTAEEFCSALFDFLCYLKIPEQMEAIIEDFRSRGELILANEYSQVWNMVIELMDQIVEVMADETFGVERFANLIRIGFSEYKIGLIPASVDQVLVGSIERSKSHAVKALYILGTNDGVFPAKGNEEGILTDDERIKLNEMGLELAKTNREKVFDENFLIYRTLTTPSDYLRISWPIADQEGRALRPSIIISQIKKIFPLCKQYSNILPPQSNEEILNEISSRRAAFRQLITVLRQKADGREILPVWRDIALWYLKNDEWKEEFERARKAFSYRNIAQTVDWDKIKKLYGDTFISSVSRFERYSACPFSFFVRYGLKARERKILQFSPPDAGTFLHTAVEKFSRAVQNSRQQGESGALRNEASQDVITWRTFDRKWCEQKVSEIVDEMLGKMMGTGLSSSKRMVVLANRLKRVVTRAVWLIAEHIRRSGFDPVDYEAGFGDNEKYPPIVIELDNGEKVFLYGRIDRIDAMDTPDGRYIRIIDYKSGTKDFRIDNVYYGLQIQLVTYLDAIWDYFSKNGKNVMPAGILYFKLDDPILKTNGHISEEEVEKAIMKQLRMKGLLLADVKLIKEMDRTIDGQSLIIPASISKSGTLGKNSSVVTMEQFNILRKYVRRLLKELSTEIFNGAVPILPVKSRYETACKYCSYLPVCQFDASLKENTYRILYEKDNDEIWNLMKRQ
ncbi:helicase-exonuclease AddAB subunit AddB [Thermoclostridium stercorarium subsp. leptospartum DSM 9219]|uniref:ATP-dependent helicase/deoxyribonuclease subunit B n=1 Tax=Thermoclostridium stercorarium subsp. leptospartum DSM 9219 TaxID=1346611 RepID=A0A1B1YMP1_THEST|nr:helicase-exonuclease AddAB subunit AddB [Thermoclostridium stercorarium]ANX02045.1 helicase-exonuclease AddAB subunit AddB [Thermoclostridium stercorarium subsp. leptospartum DSM 9219]